jgi:hypothetical protein
MGSQRGTGIVTPSQKAAAAAGFKKTKDKPTSTTSAKSGTAQSGSKKRDREADRRNQS